MLKNERKVLLNPGPATTTDSVKMAQIVPDICPRESEFVDIMREIRDDLVDIVHGDDKYTSVMFCGSGTVNIDSCLSSLLPEGKKVLIINNGAYSSRAVEVCRYYGLPHIDMHFAYNELPDLSSVERKLQEDRDIAVVYTTHHETGTGLLNPIREIGDLAHRFEAVFIVDTTSSYAMIPIDLRKDNIDFCMASAQKGLMSMTGLSFVVGKRRLIEKSKGFPKRSYYTNLYMQYHYFEETGEMHFTPPVQTIYATYQAIKEYFDEGEHNKWKRHKRTFDAIQTGLKRLGFRNVIEEEKQSGLVAAVYAPKDEKWDFVKIHDYCYIRGFTIYPGKISTDDSFRLCSLGAIDKDDINRFMKVFEEALRNFDITIPVKY